MRTRRSERLLAVALAVATLPLAARAQESKEAPPASRTITGRVMASEGQPIANARVFVREAGSIQGAPRTVRTDAEGKFSATDLSPRAYRVSADAPAYVLPEDPAGVPETFYWPGAAVTLTLVKGGVITGTVTTAGGEPIVALPVRAVRVVEKGRPVRPSRENVLTDDRGVYRMYGLRPGEYRVVAGGMSTGFFGMAQGFPQEEEVQTYYPSSTYDTASVVRVGAGDEVSGIDIRYRGIKGHAVSGSLDGALPEGNSGGFVALYRADGGLESSSLTFGVAQNSGFALYGVADGQYELVVQCFGQKGLAAASKPLHVAVRGADVTGLRIAVEAVGSIEGKVVLEPLKADPRPEACAKEAGGSASESALAWRRDEPAAASAAAGLFDDGLSEAAPGADGAFSVTGLRAGVYRVEAKLPNDTLYVKSVTGARPASGGAAPDLARDGLALAPGRTASGVTVTLAEGAATVRGRVAAAAEGQPVPAGVRVYLVPSEEADVENALRYLSARAEADGAFAIRNVPPGTYRLVARRPDAEADRRPAAWDRAERAKLRAEAETGKQEVELGACRQAADLVVRLSAAPAPRRK